MIVQIYEVTSRKEAAALSAIGPGNIAAAIRASRPAGVDSKTLTDKADGSHTKDLEKVRAFVAAARDAAALC